jgi:hypothetical protein
MDMAYLAKKTEVLMVDIDRFSDALSAFGYVDYKPPKPKKNFDFSRLDGKSILIMNKLASFVLDQMEVPLK